jgi:hypothetical protein
MHTTYVIMLKRECCFIRQQRIFSGRNKRYENAVCFHKGMCLAKRSEFDKKEDLQYLMACYTEKGAVKKDYYTLPLGAKGAKITDYIYTMTTTDEELIKEVTQPQ